MIGANLWSGPKSRSHCRVYVSFQNLAYRHCLRMVEANMFCVMLTWDDDERDIY